MTRDWTQVSQIIGEHSIWYQVFLSNTNNFQKDLFDPTGPDQNGPGSNGNEVVLNIDQKTSSDMLHKLHGWHTTK